MVKNATISFGLFLLYVITLFVLSYCISKTKKKILLLTISIFIAGTFLSFFVKFGDTIYFDLTKGFNFTSIIFLISTFLLNSNLARKDDRILKISKRLFVYSLFLLMFLGIMNFISLGLTEDNTIYEKGISNYVGLMFSILVFYLLVFISANFVLLIKIFGEDKSLFEDFKLFSFSTK